MKPADLAPDQVSGTEGAPAAAAAVPAPAPLAQAEMRRLEEEALADALRTATADAAAQEARALTRERRVQLLAPADVTGASADGVAYVVGEGAIAVHPDHVPALLEHGFRLAE